jgi:hypothetical protein
MSMMVAVGMIMTVSERMMIVACMNFGIAAQVFEHVGSGETCDDRGKKWKKDDSFDHGVSISPS